MLQLNEHIDNLVSNKCFLAIAIFIATLFLPHIYSPFAMALVVVCGVYDSVIKKNFNFHRDVLFFTIIPVLFFFNILMFGTNGETNQKFIRILPIILLPIAFSLIQLSLRQFHRLLEFYLLVCFVFPFYWISSVAIHYWQNETREHLLNLDRTILYIQVNLPKLFDFHTPYIGLYLLMSCLICWYKIKRFNRSHYLIFFFFYVLLLLFFTGRTSLFMGIPLFIFSMVEYYIKKKNKIFITGMSLALGLLIFLSIEAFPMLRDKILNVFERGFGTFHRLEYWKAAVNMAKESPVFGYGFKNYQHELIIYLDQDETTNFHNQYIEYLVPSGLTGLLSYIFFKWKLIVKSISVKNGLFVIFMIIFSLSEMTESILSRQRGVMLFSLFASLFYFGNKENETIKGS